MYIDGQVKISRAQNGYLCSMNDPKIVAQNRKRSLSRTGEMQPYQDPERVYVFDDIKQLTTFLEGNLDKALPKNDFSSTFDAAAADAAGD